MTNPLDKYRGPDGTLPEQEIEACIEALGYIRDGIALSLEHFNCRCDECKAKWAAAQPQQEEMFV